MQSLCRDQLVFCTNVKQPNLVRPIVQSKNHVFLRTTLTTTKTKQQNKNKNNLFTVIPRHALPFFSCIFLKTKNV